MLAPTRNKKFELSDGSYSLSDIQDYFKTNNRPINRRQNSIDKIGENVTPLEITEVVLAHDNIVNTDYQYYSRVLYTFVPNKLFGQLLDISSKFLYF